MIQLLLLIGSLMGQPVLPELPRVYVNTDHLPTCGNAPITVAGADDLNAKLVTAAAMDCAEVILDSTATWTDNIILPGRTGSGWIWIHPSNMGALPARGTRIGPAAAGTIPKIQTNNTSAALANDNNNVTQSARLAKRYWVTGLEITQTGAQAFVYNAIVFSGSSDSGDLPGDQNYIPQDIVIDRCYIHTIDDQAESMGSNRFNVIRGAILDSYIKLHEAVAGGETQAILANRSPGPYKFVNNYLAGNTENLMFGGALGYQGMTVSDVEFRWNFIEKPIAWRTYSPLPPAKNLFELKEGVRVLVDENVFENSWSGGQSGACIVLTPRTGQSGSWKAVRDVTIRNNVCRHIGMAISVLGVDDGQPAFNFIVNVSGANATYVSGSGGAGTSGTEFFTTDSGMSVFVNNAGPYDLDSATTLNGSIDNMVTTLTLAQANIGAVVGAVLRIRSNSGTEKVLVGGVSGADRTSLTRGYDGTSALSHTSGAFIDSLNVATLSSSLGTLTNATLVSALDRNQLHRILVTNNLFDDVDDDWGTPAGRFTFTGFNEFTLDRNTMINTDARAPIFHAFAACAAVIGTNWAITRNAFSNNPTADCGFPPASFYTPPYLLGYNLRQGNMIMGLTDPQKTAWTAYDSTGVYPADTTAAGFSVDYKNITGAYASLGNGARLDCMDEAAIRAGTPVTKTCSPSFVRLYTP